MKRAIVLGALAAALLVSDAAVVRADYEGMAVGVWRVTARAGRFDAGGSYWALSDGRVFTLGVRCIEKKLTIGLHPLRRYRMQDGDGFAIKLRVDKGPIVEAFGEAISDQLIVASTVEKQKLGELIKQMRSGSELALRIEGQWRWDEDVFRLSGANLAFGDLTKECPLE